MPAIRDCNGCFISDKVNKEIMISFVTQIYPKESGTRIRKYRKILFFDYRAFGQTENTKVSLQQSFRSDRKLKSRFTTGLSVRPKV